MKRQAIRQSEHITARLRIARDDSSLLRRGFHTRYLMEGKAHAGIILAAQQQYSVGEQMRRILNLTAATSAEDMKNWIEFLSAWG